MARRSHRSIKIGGCPEDCRYCPQAARHDTGAEASKLMEPADVLQAAQRAKDAGATRGMRFPGTLLARIGLKAGQPEPVAAA